MIQQAYITAWRAVAPWPDDAQVEQDLALSRAVVQLFQRPELSEQIALRGGTALNKLFIQPACRYPVYPGQFAEGESTRPGCHEAIVTPELCDAAREQLDSRCSADAPTRHTHKFPLRGKIICPKCKRLLSGYMITKTLGPQAKLVLCYYGILLLAIYGVGPGRSLSDLYGAVDVEAMILGAKPVA